MYRGDADGVVFRNVVRIGGQRDGIEIIGKHCPRIQLGKFQNRVLEFVDIHLLVEVFFRVFQKERLVSRLFDHLFRKLGERTRFLIDDERNDKIFKIVDLRFRARGHFDFIHVANRVEHTQIVILRIRLQGVYALAADSALGRVDDADERLVVERVVEKFEICKAVLDLLSFEKLETSVHPVRNAVFVELLLERAGNGVHSDKHGKIFRFQLRVLRHHLFDVHRRISRFVVFVERGKKFHASALFVFRPEFFIVAFGIVRNHRIGKL